jgi:hypothetical protein
MAVARLIRLIVSVVVTVIVAGILLRLLSANPHNVIVSDIHDAAQALVGPFKNVFSLGSAKASLAANWGLAAIVYLVVGRLIVGLIARTAPRGLRRTRSVA